MDTNTVPNTTFPQNSQSTEPMMEDSAVLCEPIKSHIEDKTHIVIIADTSGSMEIMGTTPCRKLNGFIQEQKGATFSCYTFEDEWKILFENKSTEEAVISELKTGGGTALYSSLCKIMDKTVEDISNIPETDKPTRVIFVIYTDGDENSSKGKYSGELGRLLVKSKIEDLQSRNGWVFLFLGSNIDAEQNGTQIGIGRNACLNYSSNEQGYEAVFRSASNAISRARNSDTLHVTFTEQDRVASMAPQDDDLSSRLHQPSMLRCSSIAF